MSEENMRTDEDFVIDCRESIGVFEDACHQVDGIFCRFAVQGIVGGVSKEWMEYDCYPYVCSNEEDVLFFGGEMSGYCENIMESIVPNLN
eukprot:TRINITY_DN3981_c0_g1_i1.p2 TRINITY_DN3981_c0_g1~~TRINITY_DN3981_c0_g1_i1.p2  ORF type:complete len:90 (-),score=20.50 TRINITY_DN3981_c0_g1_i1:120-389(-)